MTGSALHPCVDADAYGSVVDSNVMVALASLLAGLGAAAAAIVAAYALRSQQRGQQRQHDLENLRWITDQWTKLRPLRRRAAQSYLAGGRDEDALREVLNFLETCGYLVHERFISERSFDLIGKMLIFGWWYSAEAYIREIRERLFAPSLFAEFEWLKDRLTPEFPDPDRESVDSFLHREAARPNVESEDPRAS